jgi:hypothetical protein
VIDVSATEPPAIETREVVFLRVTGMDEGVGIRWQAADLAVGEAIRVQDS